MNKESALLLEQHFDTALESPDGIKKLRELILTLAMQGKLVKQDPEDQPASELLKEIQKEKARLAVTERSRSARDKSLPPIKPEEVPYPVPEGWVWVNLDYISSTIDYGTSKKTCENQRLIPVYRMGNIVEGELIDENFKYIDKNIDDLPKLYLKNSDILFNRTNSYELVGKSAIYKGQDDIATFASYLIRIRLFVDYLFPVYIVMAMNTPYYRKTQIEPEIVQQCGQANFNGTKLSSTLIPLPPLAEQRRIVAKIDELMALCDKLENQRNARNDKRLAVHTAAINRLLTAAHKNDFDSSWQFITRHFDPLYSVKENVAELKKAILTLAMQGKLVKQDPKDQPASELLKEIQAEKERLIKEGKIKKQKELPPIKPEEVPYPVPEGWEWTRLIELGYWALGSGLPLNIQGDSGQDILLCKVSDMNLPGNEKFILSTNNSVSKDIANEYRLSISEPMTIIFPKIGGAIATNKRRILTRLTVIDNNCLGITAYKQIDTEWLFKLLLSFDFSNYQTGTSVPAISQGTIGEIIVALPPLSEQRRIVAKIDELMALCDKLENQIDQATAKQTALFNAVLAKV